MTAESQAEQQFISADSRELSIIAINNLDRNLRLALLLSVESWHLKESTETANNLYRTLNYNWGWQFRILLY